VTKQSRAENLKIKYQVYRKLGYDSKTSRVLSQRSLDITGLEISKKTGKLKQNKTTKQYINVTMKEWKERDAINNHRERVRNIKNDTVYTRHGMLTRDKRYKGETGKIITIIKNQNKLSTNQAYFMYYMMNTNNLSYQEVKKQLLSNKEFEMYDKK